MALHPVVEQVTNRIIKRSRPSRRAYLAHLDAARIKGVQRSALSCTNLAHGFAAFPANDKLKLREYKQPSVAIVSSYNDMLSAHQPFEYFPKVIKDAVREVGAVAQFAAATLPPRSRHNPRSSAAQPMRSSVCAICTASTCAPNTPYSAASMSGCSGGQIELGIHAPPARIASAVSW